MRCPKCGSPIYRVTCRITVDTNGKVGKVMVKGDFAGVQYFWCPKCVKLIKFRPS